MPYPATVDAGLPILYFNVKDGAYGAKGDGVTDDTAAIAAAIAAATVNGGVVYSPPGTYLTGNQTLATKVHLRGAGIEASIWKLKNGANVDLLSAYTPSINLSGAYSTGSTTGIESWAIQDMTLDGNKANQTSGTSYPLRFYGCGYILQNVRVRNGYTGGILCDWNAGLPADHHLEAQWNNVIVHDNNGIGIQYGGPSDSQWCNMVIFYSGSHNVHITPNAGGMQFANIHLWGTSTAGLLLEANGIQASNVEVESANMSCVAILGNEIIWNGGHIYSGVGYTPTAGIQLGQGAGNTPYAGQIYQSAGVTTAITPANCKISTRIDDVVGTNGAFWFANDGGYNIIDVGVHQTAGNYCTGTPANTTRYNIAGDGLSADGTLGKGGGNQLVATSTAGWRFLDQYGDLVLDVDTSGTYILKILNDFHFGLYSDGGATESNYFPNDGSGTFFMGPGRTLSIFKGAGAANALATNGPIAVQQSVTAVALATAGTVPTNSTGESRVSPTAAVTGVILQIGTQAGQEVWVVNEAVAANTVTFAVAATSHVADGVSTVIAGLRAAKFVWNNSTNLWYRG